MRNESVEFPSGAVPRHGRVEGYDTTIGVVPADATDFPRLRVTLNHRVPRVGGDTCVAVSIGIPWNANLAKGFEGFRIGLLEENSGSDTIGEDSLAATGGPSLLTIRVREHVEGL